MQAAHQILDSLNVVGNYYQTLDKVLNQTALQLDVDAIAIFIESPDGKLDYLQGRGFSTSRIRDSILRYDQNISGWALSQKRIFSIPDIILDGKDYSRHSMLAAEKFISYHVAPLLLEGCARGILELYSRNQKYPSIAWLELFEVMTNYVSIAYQNQRLADNYRVANVELESAYGDTLEGWVQALILRGGKVERHAKRAMKMTRTLAVEMGIENERLPHIMRGALLHDIGKLAIPDSILHKPGPLNRVEWQLMRKHPEFAYQMLSPISYLQPALSIPYSHHEKWDGSGYPQKLRAEEIPLEVRIFTIVDVWDALRSDRPYRNAWSESKILKYIRDQSGNHFDPQVTFAFLDLI